MCVCIHMYVCIHIYIYIYMYTHTPAGAVIGRAAANLKEIREQAGPHPDFEFSAMFLERDVFVSGSGHVKTWLE